MAVQVEAPGQIQEFLGILRRRRWQVILPALFVLALGCVVAVVIPKKFKVKTTIELREARVQEDPQLRNPSQSPTGREIGNIVQQVIHFGRIQKIITELRWDDYARLPSEPQGEYIQSVMRNIDVFVKPKAADEGNEGSTFVDISYKDVDGKRAEVFLNRLARLWIDEVVSRDRNVLKKEKELSQDRVAESQREFEEAGKLLSDFLGEHDLPLLDPNASAFAPAEDKVEKRLAAAQAKQKESATELARLQAQREALEKRWSTEPAEIEVPLTEAAKGSGEEAVAALELEIGKRRLSQEPLKPLNKNYQLLEDEIQKLEAQILQIQSVARSATTVTSLKPNPRRPEIRTEIDSLAVQIEGLAGELAQLGREIQDDTILRQERANLLRKRDELQTEKEILEDEYRLQQAEFSRKAAAYQSAQEAYGNPFEVSEQAHAPAKPTEPNPWVIVGFSFLAGISLGLAGTFAAEYSRNCYRGVQDVARVMTVPVLGAIASIVTAAEARHARRQKLVTAVSSVVLLGGLAWFTWAWAKSPDLLPSDLRATIEDLRMQLR